MCHREGNKVAVEVWLVRILMFAHSKAQTQRTNYTDSLKCLCLLCYENLYFHQNEHIW